MYNFYQVFVSDTPFLTKPLKKHFKTWEDLFYQVIFVKGLAKRLVKRFRDSRLKTGFFKVIVN